MIHSSAVAYTSLLINRASWIKLGFIQIYVTAMTTTLVWKKKNHELAWHSKKEKNNTAETGMSQSHFTFKHAAEILSEKGSGPCSPSDWLHWTWARVESSARQSAAKLSTPHLFGLHSHLLHQKLQIHLYQAFHNPARNQRRARVQRLQQQQHLLQLVGMSAFRCESQRVRKPSFKFCLLFAKVFFVLLPDGWMR